MPEANQFVSDAGDHFQIARPKTALDSPHQAIILAVDVWSVSLLCFGAFELDLKTGELRKAGLLINLPPAIWILSYSRVIRVVSDFS